MLIELNTNYAYKLKYMGKPPFDKVRDLSTKFYRELPQALQDELYEALNRGIDILDSEPQMTAYLYAFGKMHQAKLEYAFNHLPEEFLLQPEINIIDYGCGQALGTMCYADFLRDRGYVQKVKTVTLIEPSECCLKRAVLHTSVFFPEAEIRTVHKTFDELCEGDICCDEYTPTLHILSNVLDMLNFDLKQFSNLVKLFLEGYNQFVCVGPCFFDFERDKRMDVFFERVGDNECFSETLDQYKLDPNKAWTCKVKVFTKGVLLKQVSPTRVTDADLGASIMDEFGSLYSRDGKRLLQYNRCDNDIGIIKNGTEIICDNAFHGCKSLQQIVIPDSVTTIGDGAFYWCESLLQIVIPDSVTSIGNLAFHDCKSLQRIVIPDSVTNIGDLPFLGCKSLQRIVIPDSVTTIGYQAFDWCESLQEVVLPGSVTSIGNLAFHGCKSLQRIVIPDSVTTIGYLAFDGCSSLQEVVLPDSVTSIGGGAFEGCVSLRKIHLPKTVSYIGANPFTCCERIILSSDSVKYTARNNSLIDNYYKIYVSYLGNEHRVVIPDSVTSIGNGAFDGCRSLRQIVCVFSMRNGLY